MNWVKKVKIYLKLIKFLSTNLLFYEVSHYPGGARASVIGCW